MAENFGTIRIFVIDDQNLIRRGIQKYLEKESDIEIVGYAANGAEALKKIEDSAPDVAIVDLEMPELDGLSIIKILRDRFSNIEVLVFSSHDERENINRAIKEGAKGYLIKGTPATELANAIRSVNRGYFQLGPGLMEKLVVSLSNSAEDSSKSIEKKLVYTLKKFRRITQKQVYKIARSEAQKIETSLDQKAGMYLYNFNRRYNELNSYVKGLQFKLYLFAFLQIVTLMVVFYCILGI